MGSLEGAYASYRVFSTMDGGHNRPPAEIKSDQCLVPRQGDLVCEAGTYPPPADRAVPHYVINLDLPPEYRYCKVMEDLGPAVRHGTVLAARAASHARTAAD